MAFKADGVGFANEDDSLLAPGEAPPVLVPDDAEVAVEAAVETADDGLGVASSPQFLAALVTSAP